MRLGTGALMFLKLGIAPIGNGHDGVLPVFARCCQGRPLVPLVYPEQDSKVTGCFFECVLLQVVVFLPCRSEAPKTWDILRQCGSRRHPEGGSLPYGNTEDTVHCHPEAWEYYHFVLSKSA